MEPLTDTPAAAARAALEALDQPAVIALVPDREVADGPLAGLTVAVKDNIDVAGVPTTAVDPRRTTPAEADATVVRLLSESGAVPVAKTNLDQYATGLVGTRSPFGACRSVFSDAHVSGGSSSGSAVAVASGAVDLALGTDTAGSGRVPAAFNALVGWKPTRGLLSTAGVVPACPSLDCVTTFTRDVATARRVMDVIARPDAQDPWSRPAPALPPPGVAARMTRVGVPAQLPDLDPAYAEPWAGAVERLRGLVEVVEVDTSDLLEAARLLYSGPWLAERAAAFGDALDDDPAVDPTVRGIVAGGYRVTGPETFEGLARLAEHQRRTRALLVDLDAVLLPVVPVHPTLAEVAADPVGTNARLGTYTNMVNLLDLCAVAVPGPPCADGMPFGVQLLAPAFADGPLLDLAARWTGETPLAGDDAGPGRSHVVVVGAHLSGEPLNGDLVRLGGRLHRRARTAPGSRMHELAGRIARPALVPDPGAAGGFDAEVWDLPTASVGALLATIAPPLGLGTVPLADGSAPSGFVFAGTEQDLGADISHVSGWRRRPTPSTGRSSR